MPGPYDYRRHQRHPSRRRPRAADLLLLPYMPDWRWLLDRDDSPWYPSVRLFRQGKTREYEGVLDRVRDELRARSVAFTLGE